MIEASRAAWTDVADHLAAAATAGRVAGALAVLPFGAHEQHGPQLPLGTDTFQAEHLARDIATALEAVLLPAVPYGDTWTTAGYPGTVSLATATVTAIAVDLGRSLATSPAPVSGLVVVNGDWGNRNPLAAAARTLNAEGLPTIVLDYPGLDTAAAGLRTSPQAAAGLNHAEELETSMMLAIEPGLVQTDRYAACYPSFPSDFGIRPRQLHPYSATGVFGDPASATAAKGTQLLDATVAASLAVLADFVADLSWPPPAKRR